MVLFPVLQWDFKQQSLFHLLEKKQGFLPLNVLGTSAYAGVLVPF